MDRYSSWKTCVKVVRDFGFDDTTVEAILCSKLLRRAADSSDKPFGRATGKDLRDYLAQDIESVRSMFRNESMERGIGTGM